jgi:hypothetical protein
MHAGTICSSSCYIKEAVVLHIKPHRLVVRLMECNISIHLNDDVKTAHTVSARVGMGTKMVSSSI